MYGEHVKVLCFELFFTCWGRICAEPFTSHLVGSHGVRGIGFDHDLSG